MLFKMSEDKKTTVEPTVIIAASQPSDDSNGAKKSRLTKKHVLVGVVALLVTGLVVTAALVGMKIYTEGNLEVLKYTLKENGVSQNVSVDNNVVTYHVQKTGLEAWIVQDFDKGLQVTKQLTDSGTYCYVTALNRSLASDASSIPDTTPDTTGATSTSVIYKVLPDHIADLTFLGKKASAMCQNIPTYHAVPDCGQSQTSDRSMLDNSTSAVGHREKRTPAFCATYYGYYCICGCCSIVCADWTGRSTVCTWYYDYVKKQWVCTFYFNRLIAVFSIAPTCTFGGKYYVP